MSDAVNPRPEIESRLLPDGGAIPNNPTLPVLIYRAAVKPPAGEDTAGVYERLFARQGWLSPWRNGIYPYHHYHSTSHEVLGVFAGEATVCLGGEKGFRTVIRAGDVLVIPAGAGHCNLGSSDDFGVVGAYPDGREWDLCRGKPGERPQVDWNIAEVPLPAHDPLPGLRESALAKFWQRRSG
jgi:uncharacterized protein YjlB